MKIFFTLTIALLLTFISIGQDLHFSQINQTPLLLNPANTGQASTDFRAQLNYRSQWRSIGDPYKTFLLNFDAKVVEKKSGVLSLGLLVSNDNAADIYKSTAASLLVAYDLFISKNQGLSLGFGTGFNQYRYSLDDPRWGSQYDGSGYNATLNGDAQEDNFSDAASAMDLSAGIVWHYSKANRSNFTNDGLKINLGISGFHLNKPVYDLSGLNTTPTNRRIAAHGDAFIGKDGSNIAVIPSFLVQFSGGSKEIVIGTLIRYSIQQASKVTGINQEIAVSLGGNMRLGDAFAPAFYFDYGGLGFGLSYDMNVSTLRESTKGKGGLEFNLRYKIDRK